MRRKLHPDIYEMAAGLRSAGAKPKEIAEILEVNHQTVYRWVKEGRLRGQYVREPSGDPRRGKGRPRAITPDQIARAAQLRDQGYPYHRIASIVGCSRETVRTALLQGKES